MRLRNKISGYTYNAELTSEHAASSYGQPVLVDTETGEAVDKLSVMVSELVEATDRERADLQDAGYAFAG